MIIEEGADPVIQPPRRVPHGLQDRLKEKLDQMEHNRIIAKTDEPTIWVNSLVIVERKDGSLRLRLDPKDLNSVIRREHFQIPTLGSLGGKKYFTVLDQKGLLLASGFERRKLLLMHHQYPFWPIPLLTFAISNLLCVWGAGKERI